MSKIVEVLESNPQLPTQIELERGTLSVRKHRGGFRRSIIVDFQPNYGTPLLPFRATVRQLEVLRMVQKGFNYHQIAQEWQVNYHTVSHLVVDLKESNELPTLHRRTAELTGLAFNLGLLDEKVLVGLRR